jgi:ribose/xylose/arabinose/galactoside ABC-type transport system permease subunit
VADADQRSNLERLDDLQAAHPFSYNVVVGAVMGLVLLVFALPPIVVPLYAVSYAALRWFLWQEGRVLRKQYDARAARWAAKQAERRRLS